MQKEYFTTTLPYVNAQPHIGFAREIVQADVMSRIGRLCGNEVFFSTGTDEHGQKIFEVAAERGVDPQDHSDEMVKKFKDLKESLNIEFTNFVRTTDRVHMEAAQEFWKVCDGNGHIYKKKYKLKYCVGCELEKTDSDLDHGRCPDHPNKELQISEEENYFFKFSNFQKKLLNLYKKNPDFVKPTKRFNEIISFVEGGLEDFSISRLKNKMPWGIEVPGDNEHVMYVWFDALVNYISAIGWPHDLEKFEKWWPVVQFCGKDNLRQQSAMWQAMLMSVELPNSKKIFINGFITVDGQKMSKSQGNVISPDEMVARYGTMATRYLLLSAGSFGEDTDLGWQKLDRKYNADLANGIGNLTSRIITLYKKVEYAFDFEKIKRKPYLDNTEITENIDNGRLELILEDILRQVRRLDKTMEMEKPWELLGEDEAFRESIEGLARGLFFISLRLEPFLPETSKSIQNGLLTKEKGSLFPRIEDNR